MRTLLVTKIISSLIVINSEELEFLTKALILNDLQPFFYFFVSLLFFPHSLPHSPFATSQHPNDPNTEPYHIHNIQTPLSSAIHDDLAVTTIPFATISPSRRSFADPHSQRYYHRDHHLPIPIRDDLAESFTVAVTFACRRRFYRRRICSPSSLKLDRRHRSNPSDISAPSHTNASAPFRRFNSHGRSTSTHTDCSPSLRGFKPQRPFSFHFNR